MREVAAWLRGELGPVTGGELLPGPGSGTITLTLGDLPPEAYRLAVGQDVEIVAGGPAGAFYGAQTFRQLLPPVAFRKAATGPFTVPGAYVEDAPRFRWRGCLLDVARHFMTKHDVLRFIDLLAIVAYAGRRHVMVVPEIDLPGHTQAAIVAHPELGNLGTPLEVRTTWGVGANVLNIEDSTIEFFQNVLDEVLELFPSPYVMLGGDECRKDQWRASPAAQRRMAELGLRDEEELQSWLIHRFDDYLTARGRRPAGWDEILEDVYAFEPVPGELRGDAAAERVLGAQCGIWTELIDSRRHVDSMAFPRLAAFAETVWSLAERDLAGFHERLAAHLPRLEAIGVEYRRAAGPLPWQRRPGVPGRPEDPERWQAKLDAWTSNLRTL
ncbi:beta-N-acetylhexosaminidase [Nonomuraea polychroma]|uniref:beta-N-acetylhexosaminidase n=1 Tax=Nonomuraea polychroma TaxID=46176 RepID=UPI003D8B9330